MDEAVATAWATFEAKLKMQLLGLSPGGVVRISLPGTATSSRGPRIVIGRTADHLRAGLSFPSTMGVPSDQTLEALEALSTGSRSAARSPAMR